MVATTWRNIPAQLDAILANQRAILAQGAKMAKTLDDALADITALASKEDGLIALTGTIKAQLDAALAGSLSAAQQAKVDAIFQAVEDRKTAVQTAIDANTPPSPPAA